MWGLFAILADIIGQAFNRQEGVKAEGRAKDLATEANEIIDPTQWQEDAQRQFDEINAKLDDPTQFGFNTDSNFGDSSFRDNKGQDQFDGSGPVSHSRRGERGWFDTPGSSGGDGANQGATDLQSYFEDHMSEVAPLSDPSEFYKNLNSDLNSKHDDIMGRIDSSTNAAQAGARGMYDQIMARNNELFDLSYLDDLRGSAMSFDELRGQLPDVDTSFQDQERAALDALGHRQQGAEQKAVQDAMQFRGSYSPDEIARMGQQQGRLQGDIFASQAPGIRGQFEEAQRNLEMQLRGQDQNLAINAEGNRLNTMLNAAQLEGATRGQQVQANTGLGSQLMNINTGLEQNRLNSGQSALNNIMNLMFGTGTAQLGQEFQNRQQVTNEGLAAAGLGNQDFGNLLNMQGQQAQDFWNSINAMMGQWSQNTTQAFGSQQQQAANIVGSPIVQPAWNTNAIQQQIIAQQMRPDSGGGGGFSLTGPGGIGGGIQF